MTRFMLTTAALLAATLAAAPAPSDAAPKPKSPWTFRLDPRENSTTEPMVLTAAKSGAPDTANLEIHDLNPLPSPSFPPIPSSPLWSNTGEVPSSAAAPAVLEIQRTEYTRCVEAEVTTSGLPGAEKLLSFRTLVPGDGKALSAYDGSWARDRSPKPPADFDAYWARARAELDAIPMNAAIVRVPDRDTSHGLMHRVEFDSLGGCRVVCWYIMPRAAAADTSSAAVRAEWRGRVPALATAPGAGAGYGWRGPGLPHDEYVPADRSKAGFAALYINPRHHGPTKDNWKVAKGDFALDHLDDPEKCFYRGAYMDCVRAMEWLATRPEIDPARVGYEGSSQGGLFGLALAALQPRVKCVVSNVTAFTDFGDGATLALTGHHATFQRHLDKLDDAGRARDLRTMAYFDGANMATRAKCPVQINMGALDPVCPTACGAVAYNRLPAGIEREFHVSPSARHEVPADMHAWNDRWLARWLKPVPFAAK